MGTILQLWPSWPEEGKAPKGSKPLGMTVWVTPSKMQLTTEVLSKVGGNTELAMEEMIHISYGLGTVLAADL